MGLFSNLFGNNGNDIDNALGKMKDLAEDLASVKYADEDEKRLMNNQGTPLSDSMPLGDNSYVSGPSGDSWGPVMPAEENQFNSGLKPSEYFDKIYSAEFAEYHIDKVKAGWSDTAFIFNKDGARKLVVELLSDGTQRNKLRNECRAQGVPYLRFYYDHQGWWNTRSYVVRRTLDALNG